MSASITHRGEPQLDERVVVITGAAAGIGRATAERHAADGWTVVAVDTDADACAALESELPQLTSVVGDVSDLAVLQAARERAVSIGRLEAWVNNAAVLQGQPMLELDTAHIDAVLAVNVRAVVLGTRLAAEEFVRKGTRGSIVNISSVHARLSFAGSTMYDTSKGAVEALCRVVAAELGDRGIRCNAVAPGSVMTERALEARRLAPQDAEPIPDWMLLSPAEIAEVVAFLTSPASSAINGAVLPADRGLSVTFLGERRRPDDATASPEEEAEGGA
ncbi:SDR family NAD(P)-dependent oxidoreductase [Lysobacter korlensis]|uniref:SDR family NAD(P)-dependent oxidoreductase n=1 Tax=Lysobacter korlensis TaxID=553636 RepID=A0ABV6RVA3_9GAMM